MFIVIIGASGIGESLINLIRKEKKHHIVLIDKNLENCEKIVKKHDIIVINGDATKNEILEESEINKADVLVTTTNDDSTNLMVISLAKNMGIKRFVSIVNREESIPLYMEKNVKLIKDPNELMSNQMFRAIQQPSIENFLNIHESSEIVRVSIDPNSILCGKNINKINLPKKSLILTIERDDKLYIASDEGKLYSGDVVTLLTEKTQVENIIKLFGSCL
jgi:trk system potassium uptake protein TrkA